MPMQKIMMSLLALLAGVLATSFAAGPALAQGSQTVCDVDQMDFATEYLTAYFTHPNRQRTASTEAMIAQVAPKCLANAGYPTPSAAQLQQAQTIIRDYMTTLGYRASGAVPDPVYMFCVVHFNYDPPRYGDYHNIYFFSGITRDTEPDNYADKVRQITVQESQVAERVTQWARTQSYHYEGYEDDDGTQVPAEDVTEPTDVDPDPFCVTEPNLAEIKLSYEQELASDGGEAQESGVE